MRSSLFIFGAELAHEGYGQVLDNLQRRAGVDSVSLSATYHHARDVFPHNPRHRVYRHQGDIAWFRPQTDSYVSGLTPRLADDADGDDVLARLCAEAAPRGLEVQAWTIFTHNSRLGVANPDCVTRNVFGDAYWTDLCPANPRVRAYAAELARDIARYPVRRLLAESLHYRPLEHGDHHERFLIPIPPPERRLLSLCFCPHCRAAGGDAGLDMPALARAVAGALEPTWSGRPKSLGPAPFLAPEVETMLAAFDAVRARIVASLVGEVRDALRPTGVELAYIDHAGAMAHLMAGVTADQPIDAASRRLGIDPAAAARGADEFVALGYVDTAARLERLLARYRALLGAEAPLSLALRPIGPDCADAAALAEKVALAARFGARRVDFYHYAMTPLDRLDWICAALAAARPRGETQ